MEIIDILKLERTVQKEWASKMKECDWDAGQWLASLVEEGSVKETFGENSRVLLLTEKSDILSFCTLAPQDEIDDMTLTPWIGFVYTFKKYRGHRYSGELIEKAKALAKNDGFHKIYVSSEEVGLYEKYGFTSVEHRMSVHGYMTGIFVCEI